jgi:hypothetical protein
MKNVVLLQASYFVADTIVAELTFWWPRRKRI